ncbi:hypothetical protein QC763_0017930 [Podospora pseudopauciseta]|uniref:Zn(2)-C6 fungal-type domain-containing protein n=1 Tax=Podospora pseudopauciseta TaxID=2093780 RepID=A0ABR0I0Z5_9PEZI|nr:hypothetical protein QC763_0017930 [Podospora pseudopauciseta]
MSASEAHHGIRIACTPCYRKKITCNKKLPCERCTRLKLACDERFSDRYKSRPPAQPSEPSASEEAESSAQTRQAQDAPSVERGRTSSVGSSRSEDTPQIQVSPSFSLHPTSQLHRRVVGLQDLLNSGLSSPPSNIAHSKITAPPRPIFYRASYPYASFKRYLDTTAPEVFEFAHDGSGLVSDSAIQAGIQFRLSSTQYAGVPKLWLYRSNLLESIAQHLRSSGEQRYGEEGCSNITYGSSSTMIISCFTLFSGKGHGRHGLVLPTDLGGVTIQWLRPINLLTFRAWRENNNLL